MKSTEKHWNNENKDIKWKTLESNGKNIKHWKSLTITEKHWTQLKGQENQETLEKNGKQWKTIENTGGKNLETLERT